MHNNYFFLRKFSAELDEVLKGSIVSECYSQDKDELVFRFETTERSLYLRASLAPGFSCLSLPDEVSRARKNSVDLFGEVIGLRVEEVRQNLNDRSFMLILSNNHALLFKMHGNRSNIILFQTDHAIALFRNQLSQDLLINPRQTHKPIDWSRQAFDRNLNNLQQLYFTFGRPVWAHLHAQGFASMSPDEKWSTLQGLLKKLEDPTFMITAWNNTVVLTLVPVGTIESTHTSAIEAITRFFVRYISHSMFSREKQHALLVLNTRLKSSQSYLIKTKRKLAEAEGDDHYKLWADLLMANLAYLGPGSDQTTLTDFVHDNKPVEIKLRKELTPQKNAEVYYRKSKNHHLEINRLKEGIARKEEEINELIARLSLVNEAGTFKALRQLLTSFGLQKERIQQQKSLPYKTITYKAFEIRIGKSAKDNDTLTLKHAYKDDLWLHARDVAGSHVIVKHQAGKKFPKEVIERAAQLAAFYSKRKAESLCPVSFTLKKYVRKRKGDSPGTVVLEKEEVILVEPKE